MKKDYCIKPSSISLMASPKNKETNKQIKQTNKKTIQGINPDQKTKYNIK